jgi:hypothetical protein
VSIEGKKMNRFRLGLVPKVRLDQPGKLRDKSALLGEQQQEDRP